jgi:hypothetical protein
MPRMWRANPNHRQSVDSDPSPPLVLIEWLDSGQPVPGWQWLEAIEPQRPHLCVSVGFLVQDDATAKVLAPNLGASNGGADWDQASGVITIPASAVKRMLAVSPLADTSAGALPWRRAG